MSEDQVLVERHEEVTRREEMTVSAWRNFVVAQPEYVKTFLLEQSRLAALEQSAVASRYTGGIKAMRNDVTAVIDALCVDVAGYFHGIDRATILDGWQFHDKKAAAVMRPFGQFMTSKGFDPGMRSPHPGVIPDWYYYGKNQFSEVLQRQGKGMPLAPSSVAYSETLPPLNRARTSLNGYKEIISRNEIDRAWDSA